MATKFITPSWRMPKNSNQSKASNYSIDFDGSSYISLPSSLDLGTNSTISLWFKSDSGNPNNTIIGEDSYQFDYLLQIASASDEAAIRIGSVYKIFTVTEINDGNWNHWCIVRNGDSVELFINNSSKGTQTGYGTGTNTKFEKIGAEGDNQYPITGKMAQLSAFDYALTGSAITALYNNGIPANPLAVATPPVAYYDLGQGSAYASGSAGIIEPNLAAATGSTVFNFVSGDSDFINAGSTSYLNDVTEMSISTWFNLTTAAINKGLMDDEDTHFAIYSKSVSGDDYSFRINISGSGNRVNISGTPFTAGQWHNLVMTYNAGTLTFYADGDVVGSSVYSGTIPTDLGSNAGDLRIGTYGTLYWDGLISNAQIWTKELSSAEALTLYNNGTPLQSNIPQSGSLKAWYKLGLDTSNWDGTDWVIGEAQANYSSALNFDGTNDYIDCGSFSALNSATTVTVSAWFKSSTYSTLGRVLSNQAIEIYQADSSYSNTQGRFYYRLRGNFGNQFALLGGTSASGVGNLVDGNWHHLCITFDNSTTTAIVYEDGVPVLTNTSVTGTLNSAASNLYIGSSGASSNFIDGSISNISIFNTVLDAAAISTLYNSGTPETSISSLPVSWWKLDNITTGIQDSAGSNNGTNNGATITNIQVSTLNGISSGMDSTNLVPSNLIKSIPYSGYSMDFDGSGDTIDCGDISFFNGTDRFTVSFWVYLTDDGSNNKDIISKGNTSSNNTQFFVRKGKNSNGDKIFLFLDNAGSKYIGGSTALSNDRWYNVICTYSGFESDNGDKGRVYLDGVNNTSVSSSGLPSSLVTTTQPLRIGEWQLTATDFEGQISNVALWDRVLTQDEILRVYNGGSPGDLTNLSPNDWWSLGADSYFDGSDWICPDLGSGNSNGTSINLGAGDLKGFGPDSLANGTSTNLDLGSDLIGETPGSTGNAISINMNSLARTGSTP